METSMDLASSAQLEMTDKLRELGISDYVALPQLAVVGDQSSGKSSVLESFSELPFPRDSGLCTRFATKITFRRATRSSTKVSIIPGPDRSREQATKLRAFIREFEHLTGDVFLEILRDVCKEMGIPEPGQALNTSQSTFSDDLLSIVICGPDKQNLSIIDIPGIFRTPTEGITTEADMILVRRIMNRYIRDERTIILAVIPSNTDIATQEILTIAKEMDPKGLRTLGVLTKPDLIDNGGEENVMMLVEGKRNPLRLGYHMVRNRGQSELSSTSVVRAQKERDFFMGDPWSRLERDRVGTAALQKRLQGLLIDITRREFPKVQTQITKQLTSCRLQLADLGVDRQSTEQQRSYLLEISNQYQGIVNTALDAYYSRERAFTETPELRLATLAVNRMDQFSEDFDSMGHTVQFNGSAGEVKPEWTTDDEDTHSVTSEELVYSFDRITSENDGSYPELEDLVPGDWVTPKPSDQNIMEWIAKEHKKARSFGLATIGPSVIPTIWQEQTKNWEGLTMGYIRNIVFLVHDFICKALAHVCVDERVRNSLWSVLQENLIDRYKQAINHAEFILRVERYGTQLTNNRFFNKNLQKSKTSRMDKLKRHSNSPKQKKRSEKITNEARAQNSTSIGNAEHTVEQIHDIVESYYNVARERFVDTVCMQASDYYLLTGDPSPLRVFGINFVSKLSPAQLDMIAGEENSTKQLRTSLMNQITALEKGKKLLKI